MFPQTIWIRDPGGRTNFWPWIYGHFGMESKELGMQLLLSGWNINGLGLITNGDDARGSQINCQDLPGFLRRGKKMGTAAIRVIIYNNFKFYTWTSRKAQ